VRPSAGGESWVAPACPWLGDAFHHLAGLTPTFTALHGLTRSPSTDLWLSLRRDPAAVLLLLRDGLAEDLRADTLLAHLADPHLLARALVLLAEGTSPFLDITQPDVALIYQAAIRLAERAEELALASHGRVDPLRAWIAGLFAPLAWLVVAAVAPGQVTSARANGSPVQHWGIDPDALARRLARRWSLPAWLTDTLGRLRLTSDIAADLGVSRGLFEIVQQAAASVAREGYHLGLVPLDPAEREYPHVTPGIETPVVGWRDPRTEPLLPDLLRLALENRTLAAGVGILPTLEEENERLHLALVQRLVDEAQRQQNGRLEALAELAAGAGHEINNPLAVISGQAQYLLARREKLFQSEALGSVVPSLETIVAQTRRIHGLLRQMLLFARPPAPARRPVDLGQLVGEVTRSLEELATQRKVRLDVTPSPQTILLPLDSEQIRTALTALVRNAIEAAPVDGWVRVVTWRPGPACPVEVVVEDSGPGPFSEQVPYLFDPFYSGRTAGRGKGLGLPVAWQLVRQHGGELRYVRPEGGPTRFIVRLPVPTEDHERCGNSGEAA
jgi:signal transduction histidine kinase